MLALSQRAHETLQRRFLGRLMRVLDLCDPPEPPSWLMRVFDFTICFLALSYEHSCLMTSSACSLGDSRLSPHPLCAHALAFTSVTRSYKS